ncbi:hypothetical protein SESBI_48035 [Sesbania bispinosa]|nr:hypothetical protein SESBI_48035 [Sesbania bispinosa]
MVDWREGVVVWQWRWRRGLFVWEQQLLDSMVDELNFTNLKEDIGDKWRGPDSKGEYTVRYKTESVQKRGITASSVGVPSMQGNCRNY